MNRTNMLVLNSVALSLAFPRLLQLGIERNYPSLTEVAQEPWGVLVKYGHGTGSILLVVEKGDSLLRRWELPESTFDILEWTCSAAYSFGLRLVRPLSYIRGMLEHTAPVEHVLHPRNEMCHCADCEIARCVNSDSTNKPGV